MTGPAGPDWPRPVVHFEITARDPDMLAPFYEAMFNWSIHEGPIRFFAAGLGGPEPGPGGHLRKAEHTGVTLYIQVRDLAASLEHAAALGGAVTMGAMDLPEGPTIAGITDPEGNPITLVQQ